MSQRIAYIRVSAADQNLDRQYELVGECDKIFADKLSGKNVDRVELQAMLNHVRDGDTLVVPDMSRLGRNTVDTLKMIESLAAKGVSIEFIKEGLSITGETSPWQEFQLQMLAAIAQLERANILERQAEGIAAAKAAGKHLGRKPALNAAQVAELRQRASGGASKAELAKEFGVGRATVYRLL